MFKTLKDAKRRVVESVLEGVGASEKTVDEEFNTYHARYQTMMQDINECGAALHAVLNQQKNFFNDAVELSGSVSRIHELYANPEYWVGPASTLSATDAAVRYKEKMDLIHNVYRSSCAVIALEKGLEPLKDAIAKITPEIESMVKERNTQLIDYDSYRRRVKGLKEKQEQYEQNGKGNTPAATENQAEIQKFTNKENNARELYHEKNNKTKEEILNAREQHDRVVDDLLVAVVVTQAELFARAAKELESVISLLPQDQVQEVRNKINGVVAQGGAAVPVKKEKTGFQKGVAIFTGKAVPSDFKKDETGATASAPPAEKTNSTGLTKTFSFGGGRRASAPTISPTTSASKGDSNPFAATGSAFTVDDEVPPANPPPASIANRAPPPPPPAASNKPKVMVEALYDHDAEADDELNFKAGDKVEVVETSDDGWWKGRCHGKEGLFPVNYVKTLT
eukprot:gene6424-6920_t